MRFLLDANLPRSALEVFAAAGHAAAHVRDLGIGGAPDDVIAARARTEGWVLVTRDLDLADVRAYPPAEYAGLLVLRLGDEATAVEIKALLEGFMKARELLAKVPGRLCILEPGRGASVLRRAECAKIPILIPNL